MRRGRTSTRHATGAGLALVLCAALVAGPVAPPAVAATPQRTMLSLTNQARANRDVRLLKLSSRLSRVAQHHSERMAARGELFHTRNIDRKLRGIRWSVWGENVGYSPSTLRALQKAFMHSPPHRKNLLNRRFRKVGIGVVRDDRGTFWVTLIFYG